MLSSWAIEDTADGPGGLEDDLGDHGQDNGDDKDPLLLENQNLSNVF